MAGLLERARTRIPSLPQFARRAFKDPRRIAYDLLPIASTPAARDRVARMIAMFRPKTTNFAPSAEAHRHHQIVADQGLVTLDAISARTIGEIRDYFEVERCHDPYRPHYGRFTADAPPSDEINIGYFSVDQIVRAPHVLGLFNDPLVLETAELYLGCKPLLDNIGCWWSFAGRAAAKGTQRYHRDLDSFRGLKLFIYLSDVDAVAGPHLFMRGSHRSERLDTGAAQTDETIHAAFGAPNEIALTGQAGTRFMADTFGFHKGLLPREGRRLILTAQYNVNRTPHLPPRPCLPRAKIPVDRYVNKLVVAG